MLIEKADGYVVLKLSNNDEVICKLNKEDSTYQDSYNVEKPRSLIRTHDGIGLAPYIQLGDESKGVPIAKTHVISVLPMQDDIKADYIQATTGVTMLKSTDIKLS